MSEETKQPTIPKKDNGIMNCTPSEERIAARVTQLLLSELSSRGMVYPNEAVGTRLITWQVAKELGCDEGTISRNWRKWGLRRVGRGKHGYEYCGASVARYRANLNQAKK